MALLTMGRGFADDDEVTDPFLGQPDAIAASRITYAGKCYVCHHNSGARGPNLFATKLSDQRFLETVIQGRKGTQMPAFGLRCRRTTCGRFTPSSSRPTIIEAGRSEPESNSAHANYVEESSSPNVWFRT